MLLDQAICKPCSVLSLRERQSFISGTSPATESVRFPFRRAPTIIWFRCGVYRVSAVPVRHDSSLWHFTATMAFDIQFAAVAISGA